MITDEEIRNVLSTTDFGPGGTAMREVLTAFLNRIKSLEDELAALKQL